MMIEEIIRSCVHEGVAAVAVRCIGQAFFAEIEKAAAGYGLTVGRFTAMAVQRFARRSDDTETRRVRAAMDGAQEPLLAGLHRILCIMLAAEGPIDADRTPPSSPWFQPGEGQRALKGRCALVC